MACTHFLDRSVTTLTIYLDTTDRLLEGHPISSVSLMKVKHKQTAHASLSLFLPVANHKDERDRGSLWEEGKRE